jgi:suppressor for copper-sensitivity B
MCRGNEGLVMIRLFLVLLFLVLPSQAFALAGEWKEEDPVSARLVSGVSAIGTDAVIPLGLEIKLANGWHTYWRSPGQAGLPPQLDWSRSQTEENNLQSAVIMYPAPRRYTDYGLETIGYRDHVLFPIDATLQKAGKALNAEVGVDLLACFSICVSKHFDLKLAIPEGSPGSSPEATLLAHARDQLPSDSTDSGILFKNVVGEGESLTFAFVTTRDRISQPDVFIENEKNIGFSAPEVTIDPSGFAATLKVKTVDTMPANTTLAGLPLKLTIINGDHATEIKAVAPAVLSSPAVFVPQQTSFKFALLFALIGGFILNLMPCVLPVLSLKIVSVVSHGGGDEGRVRQSFLITAAGIIFSFLVLACVTIVLKHLELAMGWGVQFQQPAFLMFLVLLLTFFAANLWGLFEISLPQFLVDRMESTYHPKLAGDFATGAFATLLATPCSAPFLGTAVGFALASGAKEILAVFFVLGFGMALPYFLVALFPRTVTLFPKPGAWMVTLRRILGFALAITALWLVWVMAAQITAPNAMAFVLLMGALMILLASKKHGLSPKLTTAGIIIVCAAALTMGISGHMKSKERATMDRLWLEYNPTALRADIAEGKTVFLDVTADWCLTCRANKNFALSDKEVVQRLFHSGVVAMQANWTSPDPAVNDLLHKYGRYGIPFNVVFGPSAPQGIVLPELLTPTLVLKALDEASGVK